MKILYILHTTDNDGSTISFINMVKGLREKGLDFAVIIPAENPSFEKRISDIGGRCIVSQIIQSVYTPIPNKIKQMWIVIKLALLKFGSFYRMCKIAKKEAPDIIHTNSGVVQEGFSCALYNGIPHVWHIREYQDIDFGLHPYPSKKLYSMLLRKSYVASITKNLLNHFGLAEDFRHRVIYNGILYKNNIHNIFPKEKFFLCASRVSPEKGLENVIECFAKIHSEYKTYKLVICGFGDETYVAALKQYCIQQKCLDSVEFVGFTNDIQSYMSTAKALIVGSYNEGFGRMTAEAAFCGCLVIGRNTGGTKEIMDNTGGFPFLTKEELLAQMRKLVLMNDSEYKMLVNKSQKKAVQSYSIEDNIDAMYKFYCDIVN